MALYYKLDDKDYKGDKIQIGDIMLRFQRKLYDDYKLKLCNLPLGSEYEKLFRKNMKDTGYEVLLEETLWKNMTEDQKIDKIIEYIKNIGGVNQKILIMDPYFFCKKPDQDYENLITQIFKKAQFQEIQILTRKDYNKVLYNSIKSKIKCNIKLLFTDEIHDRFWIANKSKGFCVGTSLNGIGKKYSRIEYMDNDEVKDYIDIANKIATKQGVVF